MPLQRPTSRPTFHRSACDLPASPERSLSARAREPARDAALLHNPRYHIYRFHSAILPDDRDLLVYLPPPYFAEPNRRFPVFYLHDGQNLFDPCTSYVPGRTWQAHTSADRLALAGEISPVILIGLANTGLRRMAEYTPTRDFKMGGGEGNRYARLLIEEVKPFLDRSYRTLPQADHTAVGGSSLGGLISLFLGLEHPHVFSRLAVLSPSLWWNHRSILARIDKLRGRLDLRLWLDIGTEEGARHVRDTDQLYTSLRSLGWTPDLDLAYTKVAGGTHDEEAWAARFPAVLRFLFPPR